MKGENVQGTGAQAPFALTLSAAMQVTQVPSVSCIFLSCTHKASVAASGAAGDSVSSSTAHLTVFISVTETSLTTLPGKFPV